VADRSRPPDRQASRIREDLPPIGDHGRRDHSCTFSPRWRKLAGTSPAARLRRGHRRGGGRGRARTIAKPLNLTSLAGDGSPKKNPTQVVADPAGARATAKARTKRGGRRRQTLAVVSSGVWQSSADVDRAERMLDNSACTRRPSTDWPKAVHRLYRTGASRSSAKRLEGAAADVARRPADRRVTTPRSLRQAIADMNEASGAR